MKDNHAESLSDKIEYGVDIVEDDRQVELGEPIIKISNVKEFIQELKRSLCNCSEPYGLCKGCLMIEKLAGEELANHSPHVKLNSEKNPFLPKHEDTQNQKECNCYVCASCEDTKKGCGKVVVLKVLSKIWGTYGDVMCGDEYSGEIQLCPKCSPPNVVDESLNKRSRR